MLKMTGVPTKKKVLVDTKGPPVEDSVVAAVPVPVPVRAVEEVAESLWEAGPVGEPGKELPLLLEPAPEVGDGEGSDVSGLLLGPLLLDVEGKEGDGNSDSGKTGEVDVLEVVPPPPGAEEAEPVDEAPAMEVPVEDEVCDPESGGVETVPEVDVPATGPVDVDDPNNVPEPVALENVEEVERTNVDEDDVSVSFRSP